MGDDHAGLVVERTVAILTQIALNVPMAAVLDRAVRTTAGPGNSVTAASVPLVLHSHLPPGRLYQLH